MVYEVKAKASAASKTVNIANAKVIVSQTAAGGVTKLETVHQYNNTLVTDADSTYTSQQYDNSLNKANWYGGTFAAYFESDLKTSSSSDAYYARLDYGGGIGEVTASDTSYTRKTSSDLWSSLPSSATDIYVQLKNASTSTTSLSNSWLIITGTNLQVPEKVIFALPVIFLIPIIIKKRKQIQISKK